MNAASNHSTSICRWLKWTALGLFAVVIVAAGALIVAFYSIDWGKHTSIVADEVRAATGRELKVQGDVTLGLFPPRLIVNDVSLANAPWGSRPEMFKARHIDLSVSYAGLIQGELDLNLLLNGSELLFERSKKGISNWDVKRTPSIEATPEKGSTTWSFRITRIDLRQVIVTMRSAPGEAPQRYDFDELRLAARDESAVDVGLIAAINGSPVRLTGVIGDIDAFLQGHASTSIDVNGDVAGVRVQAKGSMANMKGKDVIEAVLNAQSEDMTALGKLLGVELPAKLPAELETHVRMRDLTFHFSKFRLSTGHNAVEGDWTLDVNPEIPGLHGIVRLSVLDMPAFGSLIGVKLPVMPVAKLDTQIAERDLKFHFSKFHVSVGDSLLEGDWRLDLKPKRLGIRGVVREASLDVPQLTKIFAKNDKPGAADQRFFPDSPWPVDVLHTFDLDLDAKVSKLRASPGRVLKDMRAKLRLLNGHLSIDPLILPTFGGKLDVRASLNAPRGAPAQLILTAKGAGIDLGKTLSALGFEDLVIGGPSQVAVDLQGAGATPAAVAASLDGHVRIVVGPGRVRNTALLEVMGGVFGTVLKAINPFQEKTPYSELQCLVINVPVRDGVVEVKENVAFETDQVGVSSAGAISLGKEEIDLAVKPKAKAVLDVGLTDIAGLVRIRGPWTNAKVEIDPEGTAKSMTRLWVDIATGGATWLADKLIFTPYVLDAPCKAALKNGTSEKSESPEKTFVDILE